MTFVHYPTHCDFSTINPSRIWFSFMVCIYSSFESQHTSFTSSVCIHLPILFQIKELMRREKRIILPVIRDILRYSLECVESNVENFNSMMFLLLLTSKYGRTDTCFFFVFKVFSYVRRLIFHRKMNSLNSSNYNWLRAWWEKRKKEFFFISFAYD